jgi:hypothetical protein
MLTEENVLYELILDTWIDIIDRLKDNQKWILAMKLLIDI